MIFVNKTKDIKKLVFSDLHYGDTFTLVNSIALNDVYGDMVLIRLDDDYSAQEYAGYSAQECNACVLNDGSLMHVGDEEPIKRIDVVLNYEIVD